MLITRMPLVAHEVFDGATDPEYTVTYPATVNFPSHGQPVAPAPPAVGVRKFVVSQKWDLDDEKKLKCHF